MLAGDIAKQYLQKFRSYSTLQIARKMCEEHPLIFADTENARNALRYYRGAKGKKLRKSLADDSNIRTLEEMEKKTQQRKNQGKKKCKKA